MHRKTPLGPQCGVTLIEVLIVVAILSLIAAGVAVAAYDSYEDAKKTHTRTLVRTLRHAVQTYQVSRGKATCPSFEELLDAGAIDEDSPAVDPWGSPWETRCSGSRVVVRSLGPDAIPQTDDDIVVPAHTSGTEGFPSPE